MIQNIEFRLPNFKPLKLRQQKIKLPKLSLGLPYSSREPLPAKVKNKVKERVKQKFGRLVCEQCGKKPYGVTLEFHHKNMKNTDNRVSNIQLLCPTQHRGKHSRARRKVYRRPTTGRKYYSRLIKKKPKKKGKRRSRRNNSWSLLLGPSKRFGR